MTLWSFFATHRQEILAAIEQHLMLVGISIFIAILIAVPLGILAVTRPRLRALSLALANIFQTIPSLEAAEAMGMSGSQVMFRVRLPLAKGFILAGIRTATVITIGIATIAAAIGAGGLGTFIFRGVAMVSNVVILAGAIPAAILALLADYALGFLERLWKVN